ncbi:hypothetical protein WCE37_03450 [Luteimonas sp. MJ250]|uniref:hypothetical protein n=1 Tax=Luteimonas sp. MJ250 TaxID=3129236 RepID=UPI0031BA46BB
MADHDKPAPPTPGPDPLAHLMLRDTRTPEERRAAEAKENARRKGRHRKDWWKDCPPKA